jgi:hypothetical protein
MGTDKTFLETLEALGLTTMFALLICKARANAVPIYNSTFKGSRDGMKVH